MDSIPSPRPATGSGSSSGPAAGIGRLCAEGVKAARQLESGSPDAPLTAAFQRLEREVGGGPLTVLVVPMDAEARRAAGVWLGMDGPGWESLCARIPVFGQVEVLPAGRVAFCDSAIYGRREFRGSEAFLADLEQAQDAAAVRGWVSRHATMGVRWRWFDDPARLVSSDESITEGVSVLVGVFSQASSIPPDGWWEVVARVGWYHPWLLAPGGAPMALPSLPEGVGVMPLSFLSKLTPGRIPVWEDAAVARDLSVYTRWRRSSQLLDALDSHAAQLLRQTRQRFTTLERSDKAGKVRERAEQLKSAGDRLRLRLADGLQAIQRDLEEVGLGEGRGTGATPYASVMNRIQAIAESDLTSTPKSKVLELTLSSATHAELLAAARAFADEALKTRRRLVRQRHAELLTGLDRDLAAEFGRTVGWAPSEYDTERVSRALEPLLELSLRYSGEMPKRGFFHSLLEGRKAVFTVMMMFTLFGGLGTLRSLPIVQTAIVVLFLGGVVWTVHAWKTEDRERMDKELERVRLALSDLMKKMATDCRREVTTRLAGQLTDFARAHQRDLDAFLRQVLSEAERENEAERERLREQLRVAGTRLREGERLAQDISRLREQAAALRQPVAQALESALRAAPGF